MTAFSNSTEFDMWAAGWCYRCVKDEMGVGPEGAQCSLISLVMIDNTVPEEWENGANYPRNAYICKEFQGESGKNV